MSAVDSLPPTREREVIELAYYSEACPDGSPTSLSLPLGTVRTHPHERSGPAMPECLE